MNADPHCWKTPQAPRGMPPSAWPARRRELYVEAAKIGDPTAPQPVHAPGECEECDIMRELLGGAVEQGDLTVNGARGAAGLEPAPADAGPELDMWTAGPPLWERIGNIKAYPGSVALLVGLMAGIGLCSLVGPGWGVALALLLGLLAVIAAA